MRCEFGHELSMSISKNRYGNYWCGTCAKYMTPITMKAMCINGHEFDTHIDISDLPDSAWCSVCDAFMLVTIGPVATPADSGHLLLDEAYKTVNQDRRTEYGTPEDEFANIAAMWSAITGVDINSRQVALMMIALKLCRENSKHKHDNLVDIVGYTLCLERILGAEVSVK